MNKYTLIWILLIFTSCQDEPRFGIDPIPVGPQHEYPAWSPDGSRIIYFHNGIIEIKNKYNWSYDFQKRGLWIVNSDGSNPYLLINASFGHGEWEDSETILASLDADIYRIPLKADAIDTAGVVRLTDSGGLWPSVSYDGQWIAYDSEGNSIWQMKADGTRKKRIKEYARMPHYSPNSYHIVYGAWENGVQEIFSMNDIGNDVHQLTFSAEGWRRYPKYSPDGNRIVFQHLFSIMIMNVDGSELFQIKFIPDIFDLFLDHGLNDGMMPNWSPDSQYIIFVRTGLTDYKNNGTLWITSLDGSELRQLTYGVE